MTLAAVLPAPSRLQLPRLAADVAVLMAALMAPTLIAYGLDTREIAGASVWAKPLKFEASLTLHFATLAWLLPKLGRQALARPALRLAVLSPAVAAVGEIAYIVLQAGRGRASHFNFDTPLENAMYGLMGVGAVVIVLGALAVGLAFARVAALEVGAGLKLGVVLGLVGGAAATLLVAGLMSSGVVSHGHLIGAVASDADGLPLLGWATRGGDLRVPHFFATHAMQALPLAGLLADRFAPARARPAVAIAAILWFALVAVTFAQALLGRPLLAI